MIQHNTKNTTKQVTWGPVTSNSDHYSFLEDTYGDINTSDIWYSPQELHAMRLACRTAAGLYRGEINDIHCRSDNGRDLRGLEGMTEQGGWERFQHHRDCINKVLDEQYRQHGVDSTDMHHICVAYPLVKFANHLHIPFDHHRLGALCRDATAKARRAAYLRGKKDYEVVQEEHFEMKKEMEHLQFKLAMRPRLQHRNVRTVESTPRVVPTPVVQAPTPVVQVVPTPVLPAFVPSCHIQKATTAVKEEEEDCDSTVAEEASYSELSYEHSNSENSMDSDLLYIFQNHDDSLSEADLQLKYERRYSSYLEKRNARLESQKQVELDFEARRLARKAAIWEEVEEPLEKMHAIYDRANRMAEILCDNRRIRSC